MFLKSDLFSGTLKYKDKRTQSSEFLMKVDQPLKTVHFIMGRAFEPANSIALKTVSF